MQRIDLTSHTVGLYRDGHSDSAPSDGRPRRIDGYVVGAPRMSHSAPHGGEMHPDADEVLFLVSGRVTVHVDGDAGAEALDLAPGDACVVPRGVWHRVEIHEPSQLIHITPGPGGGVRPRTQ